MGSVLAMPIVLERGRGFGGFRSRRRTPSTAEVMLAWTPGESSAAGPLTYMSVVRITGGGEGGHGGGGGGPGAGRLITRSVDVDVDGGSGGSGADDEEE